MADSASDDLLLAQINPSERAEVPTAASDILKRQRDHLQRQPAEGNTPDRPAARAGRTDAARGICRTQRGVGVAAAPAAAALRGRRHCVDGGAALAHFGADTKTNTSPVFLERLFDLGQQTADTWLQQHRHDLGRRSSYSGPAGLDG